MYRILHIPTAEYLRQYQVRASEKNHTLIHPKNYNGYVSKLTIIATFQWLSDAESALDSLVVGFKGPLVSSVSKHYRLIREEFEIVEVDDV